MYIVAYCWLTGPQKWQKNSSAEVEADYINQTPPPATLTATGYPPESCTTMTTAGSSQKTVRVIELGGNWWIYSHHQHPKLTCLKCGLPLCTGKAMEATGFHPTWITKVHKPGRRATNSYVGYYSRNLLPILPIVSNSGFFWLNFFASSGVNKRTWQLVRFFTVKAVKVAGDMGFTAGLAA